MRASWDSEDSWLISYFMVSSKAFAAAIVGQLVFVATIAIGIAVAQEFALTIVARR